jgi:hypothetical protein
MLGQRHVKGPLYDKDVKESLCVEKVKPVVGTTSGTHCYCNRVSIKLVVSFMLVRFSSLV